MNVTRYSPESLNFNKKWRIETLFRKTFLTRLEAEDYRKGVEDNEGIAVIGSLGDKFRVYGKTKEDIIQSQQFSPSYDIREQRFSLHRLAYQTKDSVDNVLKLQSYINTEYWYEDYETIVEVARILREEDRTFKTADDVFKFIDNPESYLETINTCITEILDEYDYDAKYELAKE